MVLEGTNIMMYATDMLAFMNAHGTTASQEIAALI